MTRALFGVAKSRQSWFAAIAVAMLALATLAGSALAAGTVKVSGNTATGENQPGWLFNRDTTTDTPFEFNTDEASIGAGSLHVLPIGANPADKMVAEFFLLSPLAEVETISYDFQIGDVGDVTDANQFYLNVYANFAVSDDNKFYDCRYEVVPALGSTAAFTTVTFDPTQPYPVTTRSGTSASPFPCPAVPAEMGAGATLRMFALNVGDSSGSDVGLGGYLDNVVVTLVGGDATTYDFDPIIVAATKDDCKQGGWEDMTREDGTAFKNQGDCVSFVSNGK